MKRILGCLTVCLIIFLCVFSLVACSTEFEGTEGSNDNCQHTYGEYTSDLNATCSQDGTKTAYCIKCGVEDTVTDVGSKLKHTVASYSYDDNASCTQEGTKTGRCLICNTPETIVDEKHPMLDHSFIDYKFDGNAKCDINGTKTAVCDTCKIAKNTVEAENTAGHNYINGACSVCHASHLIYELYGAGYAVTGIADDCTSTEIIIPASENGRPVFSIVDNVFENNTTITKVTFPGTVSVIGNYAFSGCTALESVTFSEGLERIMYQSFANCTSLESIVFPESMESIGNEALVDCTKLKTVSFGKNVTGILQSCFDGCMMLESVNISEENQNYYNYHGIICNRSLTRIIFVPLAISGKVAVPDGLTELNSLESFQHCSKITAIYIPKSVSKINSFVFNGCSSLADLYYEGSEEDWEQVIKQNYWLSGAPEFTIHFNCSIEDYFS